MEPSNPANHREIFDVLAKLEARYWWFLARNRLLIWVLDTWVKDSRCLLEVGCGTGYILRDIHRIFPEAKIVGTELFYESLDYARERLPFATLRQLDARHLAETELYDLVAALDVIEHIDQDQQVLVNLAKSLQPAGWLLLTVPQHRWLWSTMDEVGGHFRRYTRGELVAKVGNTGMSVEYVTSHFSLLIPVMWLSRLFSRLRQNRGLSTGSLIDRAGINSEINIPGWLDRILLAVMKVEFKIINLGFSFPIGGSLLLLARKPMPGYSVSKRSL